MDIKKNTTSNQANENKSVYKCWNNSKECSEEGLELINYSQTMHKGKGRYFQNSEIIHR